MKLRDRTPAVWLGVAVLLLFFVVWKIAHAATTSVTVNWTAPTLATDGTALTGGQVITSYQVWVSTVSIPDNVTGTPTATITGTATTTTQAITATPGATIFARVKACNAAGCSVLSNQATTLVPLTIPNPPTNVTVTLNIT